MRTRRVSEVEVRTRRVREPEPSSRPLHPHKVSIAGQTGNTGAVKKNQSPNQSPQTPIYEATLKDTGCDPEGIMNRPAWTIAAAESRAKRRSAPGGSPERLIVGTPSDRSSLEPSAG